MQAAQHHHAGAHARAHRPGDGRRPGSVDGTRGTGTFHHIHSKQLVLLQPLTPQLAVDSGLPRELVLKCRGIGDIYIQSYFLVTFLETAFMDEIWTFAIKMINFGVAIFAGCYIFVTSLNYSAERQVREEGGGRRGPHDLTSLTSLAGSQGADTLLAGSAGPGHDMVRHSDHSKLRRQDDRVRV